MKEQVKMKTMKTLIISAIATVLISPAVFGGPLETKVVGGDAMWVAHVDIEAMLTSDLGKMFLAQAKEKEGFAQGILNVKKTMGFDPLADIRGITLYGPQLGSRDGVVVVDATVASDKIIDLLKENKSYESAKYDKHTIHQWVEEKNPRAKGQKRFGCFYDNKTVVVASGLKRLQSALDVLDGQSDAMSKTKSVGSLPEAAKGAFFVLAADKIEFPEGKAPKAAIMKNISAVAIQCGECDGEVFVGASVQAGSEEDAVNMRTFVNGFLALSQMMRQQEKFAALQDLGEKIEVGGKGKEVRIDATISVKSIERVLTFMDENRKARGARRAEAEAAKTQE